MIAGFGLPFALVGPETTMRFDKLTVKAQEAVARARKAPRK